MSKQENTKLTKKIVDIYKKLLLRDPDRNGLLHWIKKITDNEITIEELEQLIKNSPELRLCNEFKQGFIHTSQGFELNVLEGAKKLSKIIIK